MYFGTRLPRRNKSIGMTIRSILLAGLISLAAASPSFGQAAGRPMPTEFRSDNCTLFPDGDYAECCVAHDRDYFFGGSLKERRSSDKRLRNCVKSKGKGWERRLLANAMYIGVRLGGISFLPTPFRWGFGNRWPRQRPVKIKPEPARPQGQQS